MATINYLYRSSRPKANLNLRLLFRRDEKDIVIGAKTKILVESNYWKIHNKKSKDVVIRNRQKELNEELFKLEVYLLDKFNKASLVNKDWLQRQIELYYNPVELEESISYWIDYVVENSNLRNSSKGSAGISQGRIAQYNRLKILINDFQESLSVREIDYSKLDEIKKWMLNEKQYSPNYTNKKIADIKTICKTAKSKGIKISDSIDGYIIGKHKVYDDDMDVVTLNLEEIALIEKADIIADSLLNARKWLILACFTGQRGESLVTRIKEDNFHEYKGHLVIKITQKKGNKPVIIPVLPKVKEIYDSGLPYKVSTQKLNEYFKIIGKEAGLNKMITGKLEETVDVNDEYVRRRVKRDRPKYEYISTHIGRRSFATNHYGVIPTPLIMKVTGHSKESTFLKYINQSDDSHIEAFLKFYE